MHVPGYLVNTASVTAGSALGALAGTRLPEKIKQIVLSGIGLATIIIGVQMALETKDLRLMLGSLLLGGIIGQIIGVEEWLERLGEKLKRRIGSTSGTFVLGFVTASILFCAGPLTIVGSLEDGYAGIADLIYVKSIMDGVAAVALTASMGIGVIFAAATVLIFQGALTYLGMAMGSFIGDAVLNEVSAVGGLIILGIGFNFLTGAGIKVGNFIPALAVVALMAWCFIR